ncbi:MAG: Do family serine endopeptidase [Bacteroidia bacterium]
MKKSIATFLLGFGGAALGFGVMHWMMPEPTAAFQPAHAPLMHVNQPAATDQGQSTNDLPNFVQASAMATPAVVHIKSFYSASASPDPFHGFFGSPFQGGMRPQSAGSGVIISGDGYIATNNHVVKNAEKVEVVLEDKRTYEATVVGTDPNTDLALLKIEQEGLTFLPFGNSNDVQVGQWVLAVGNPFNLTSTVTAGIVSAKGRSLNLLDEEFAIESFIQTDAAVNPGNSGGALISTTGELVGINTAIASETGSYAGYSFAIPVNIVRKVMEDLREFGEVQRGIIGVQIQNINTDVAEKYGLKTLDGALVTGTIEGGAAQAAGITRGDVITHVNQTPIRSSSELQEVIGTYRPGDKVALTLIRDGKTEEMDVTLRSKEGKTTLSERLGDAGEDGTKQEGFSTRLGAQLASIAAEDRNNLGVESGVKVIKLRPGKLQSAGLEEGFVILKVNKQPVSSPKDVERQVSSSDGGVLIEGVTTDGKKRYYAFE